MVLKARNMVQREVPLVICQILRIQEPLIEEEWTLFSYPLFDPEKHYNPGKPPIAPRHKVWDCSAMIEKDERRLDVSSAVLGTVRFCHLYQCTTSPFTSGLFAMTLYQHYALFVTRIKATRCETLRTVTTNNSKNHSHSTYYFNVSLMVQKWTATIFSTSEPILLIVHETNLFWYVTTNI